MGFSMKQSMKLSMQLRMTPQLQQAIKLLQLSRTELETAVRKEMEENPILEEFGEDGPPPGEPAADPVEPRAESNSTIEAQQQSEQDPRRQDEFEWENYVDNTYKMNQGAGGPPSEEIMNYENIISTPQSLHDHLMWQMNLHGFNEDEFRIASILVSYIDDDGYIKTPFEEIAQEEGVTAQELEEVLPFVQEFDPPGVGARDIKECLLIQAKQIQEDTHDLVYLINNHLKDLEKKNFDGIAKAMNRDLEDIIEMSKIIYDMEPKPGRIFATQDTHYVTPDV
ncbi:MAG TPA: RNA polymerase sigma-54 factor, partial [Bdellovibrionales bacterium]|nr:RNA polymerase sigma-54 factor [Bdellovibrionales bacterium]